MVFLFFLKSFVLTRFGWVHLFQVGLMKRETERISKLTVGFTLCKKFTSYDSTSKDIGVES